MHHEVFCERPQLPAFQNRVGPNSSFYFSTLLLKVQTPLQVHTSVHFSYFVRVQTPALIIIEFAVHMSARHIFTYQVYIQKKIDHLLAKDRCPTMKTYCLQQSKVGGMPIQRSFAVRWHEYSNPLHIQIYSNVSKSSTLIIHLQF